MASLFYQWRKLRPEERKEVLASRKRLMRPWHSPPHLSSQGLQRYHVTAACYEHQSHIGRTPARMDAFSASLLAEIENAGASVSAWCVLPNHYHLLLQTAKIPDLLQTLGRLHGRSAYFWNREDGARGRKVFYRTADRAMRSDRHYWSTLNYVHNNPVHHGYVEKWADWPWSSAGDFLKSVGEEDAARIWNDFPVLEYGKGWDDPNL